MESGGTEVTSSWNQRRLWLELERLRACSYIDLMSSRADLFRVDYIYTLATLTGWGATFTFSNVVHSIIYETCNTCITTLEVLLLYCACSLKVAGAGLSKSLVVHLDLGAAGAALYAVIEWIVPPKSGFIPTASSPRRLKVAYLTKHG